jgi:hypothetical protein
MQTVAGALITESLRVGASVEGVPLRVTKIVRADVGDTAAGQPLTWTFSCASSGAEANRIRLRPRASSTSASNCTATRKPRGAYLAALRSSLGRTA